FRSACRRTPTPEVAPAGSRAGTRPAILGVRTNKPESTTLRVFSFAGGRHGRATGLAFAGPVVWRRRQPVLGLRLRLGSRAHWFAGRCAGGRVSDLWRTRAQRTATVGSPRRKDNDADLPAGGPASLA